MFLRDNRGVLFQIARQLKFSRVYVGEIYWEKKQSAGRRVEVQLAKRGAPGFEDFSEAAALAS